MRFTTIASIQLNGRDAPGAMMDDLLEVVVDSTLYVPSMFSFRLLDPHLRWVDSDELDIGTKVEIGMKTSEGRTDVSGVLIAGEITALEPDFSAEDGTTLLVRGYDRSHRLHRGKKTRTFLKVTDGDLVRRIAQEAGLTPDVDSTDIIHDYVLQNNQTNMEFLLALAARTGYQVYAADGKLSFKKRASSFGVGPKLVFLENLISFKPCWSVAHQADRVTVLGWDSGRKQPISEQSACTIVQGGVGKAGGDAAKEAFREPAAETVVDRLITTSAEARQMAAGLSAEISREAIQAEGLCRGDPRLKAGLQVNISRLGRRFSGDYYLTSATHIYHPEGYETRFSISGCQPNTLTHLLESTRGDDQRLIQGVVRAIVTNTRDPEGLCRVKVKYVWLGENIESDWLRIASPMAGAQRGLLFMPEVNDEVLLAFEQGDGRRAYVLGGLWNDRDKPPEPSNRAIDGEGKVAQRIIKTRAGHVIVLDDTTGAEKIIVRDKTGHNSIVIDSKANSMAMEVDGDFTVNAKGKISLKSNQDMSLESANLKIEAKANAAVKGAQLALEGTAKAELKAPAASVNGSAMTEIKGGLIKIN